MPGEKKYIFNEQTQSYEIDRRSARAALYRTGGVLLAGLAYAWRKGALKWD